MPKSSETLIIDWELVLQFTNQNTEAAKNIIGLLIQGINEEYAPNLEKFIEEKDFDALAKMCHKIAGGARYCGTKGIENAAANLEDAAKENDIEQVKKCAQKLLEEMDKIPTAFEEILKSL